MAVVKKEDAISAFKTIMMYYGIDDAELISKTPARVISAYDELLGGYKQEPEDVVGELFPLDFPYDEIVSVKEINFDSLCEHHFLPFSGKVNIAYYPTENYVGLSKIARLVNVFARRAQVQERLTWQIAHALMDLLSAQAVGVQVTGSHMCMALRGVKVPAKTTTVSFLGDESLFDKLNESIRG
jgi:GTP cyclohydrolase I|tara:strand:+ start:1174 stop:1725 length:552 start_codon:yes stop_codon:yes gene_type:complete